MKTHLSFFNHTTLKTVFITLVLILSTFVITPVSADVVLKTIDFSAWSDADICASTTSNPETVNGVTFYSKVSSSQTKKFNISSGVLTWCNNNYDGGGYYLGFPITGINDGTITIKVWNGSSNTRFTYKVINEGTTFSTSAGSGTAVAAANPATVTVSSLGTAAYVYIGRQGSGYTQATKIEVTTPGTSCTATAPGTISKGTLSAGTITLTAAGSPATSNTWYWQTSATGTAKTESGATKTVSAAGTYYIRSYHSDDCWSDAKSITLTAEDFLTPCQTPSITAQPSTAAASYDKGDAATALSVTASVTDGGSLSYQWYSNTTASNSGGTPISGATNATYTPSTDAFGTLYYYCVVTNSLSGHSAVSATSDMSGAITVNSTCPGTEGGTIYTISIKNTSLSGVEQGTEVALASTYATETGGTAYLGNKSSTSNKAQISTNGSGTVYFNGNDAYVKVELDCPIQTGDELTFTSGSGSNQICFTTTNARATTYATSGNTYTFPAAFNGVSTIYIWRSSGSGTYMHDLTISRPTTCTPNQLAYAVTAINKLNTDADFINPLTNPLSLPVAYSSTVESVATVAADGTVSILGAGSTVIKASYTGSAYCVGEVSYTLTVSLPLSTFPTITSQPVGATYEVGEAVTPLSVAATGSGTLSYQWQKDGVNIDGAIYETYTPDASGSYTCVVSNIDAGHSPASVTSDAAAVVIKTNNYYLQGISGTSGTGTFTGDFFTTATMGMDATASYDGVTYTKAVAFGNNYSDWSNLSYTDRCLRYDCKSTLTEFTIIMYNKKNQEVLAYVGNIVESEIGSANIVSSWTQIPVSANSQKVETYTISNDNIRPRSFYLQVSDRSNLEIAQIIVEEKGTLLPKPSDIGYKVNYNKARMARRATTTWLDDVAFEHAPRNNMAAGTATYVQLSNKDGSEYIQIVNSKAATLRIGTTNTQKQFYLADNKTATKNVTIFPPRKATTDTTYSALIDAGTHYIVANGGNIYISSLELIPAIRINYNANGGSGTMKSQVVSPGEAELSYNMFLRPGYSFRGWCENPDGSGTITRDGGIRTIADSPEELTLYAIWIEPCSAVPVLKQKTSYITIKDGQYVDMALYDIECDFDTTGIHYSVQSATPAIPGCTFEYYDDQLHIWGTPSIGNASLQTFNVTIVMTNDCSPATTFSMTQEIRVNPASRKEKIAFIIDGDENNNVFPIASSTKGSALVTYLRQFYDVDYVNGYATKDEDAIANFYKDYDLLIVTDYLETPKGYTNAIGTLIDQKPILSFEAYVAGENGSNWHINSTPADPSPKTGVMKVLCSGHAIFKNAESVTVLNPDTTINVLASISGKGLQGFVINEAPDFAFIATARDANNNRDLIVCCERQVVFQARLLMYCINFNDMGNLSEAGRVVMHQMIDYLLMTDETKVADCSLVFDNGAGNTTYDEAVYHASGGTGYKGDGLWSTAANWKPGYNIVPTPYHGARIVAECHVDAPNAHAGGVKINYGRDENGQLIHGKLIIEPTGGLLVAGMVKAVNDTRYASPLITKPEDLIIQADADHNGALVFGEKTSDVQATVQYYSRGRDATSANPVWQYMGIPLQARQTAMSMFYESWMCQWTNEADGSLGGKWKWVDNYDILIPFEGYCITQESAKTFTFKGRLNQPISRTLQLDAVDDDGFAIVSNSWTAPIKIQELETTDFVNAEAAIYIYHTGTYADWSSAGNPVSAKTAVATNPGQYAVIPVHSSPYLAGADSVIPAMQGFGVHTTDEGASLTLNYGKVVYDAKNFTTSTQPMRAPSRRNMVADATDKPDVMTISLSGTANGDLVYILSRADFTDGFENGWDGRKIPGDAAAPMLAVVKEGGDMAVAAVPTLEERYLTFRAGADSVYTFSFNYDGEPIYLYDQVTRQATLINSANTYTFTANNKTAAQRFLITKNPPLMPTDLEMVETDGLFHFENYARQAIEVRIFDVQGRVVYTLNTNDEIVDIAPALPVGVYMARIKAGDTVKVVKLIGKEGAL